MNKDCDLAIVGGGPAGLAAATVAAELGLETRVFDEQQEPGGQIYRNVETVARSRPEALNLLGEDYRHGLELVEAFRQSGAAYLPDSSVWDVGQTASLGVSRNGNAEMVRSKHVLLACGAMERPVPIPGWTLPGVMSAGAAQTLLKSSGLLPAVPTVIAGSGPLLYLIAWQLVRAGAPPQAVLLTRPRRHYLAALPELPRVLAAGDLIWKGLAWRRQIRRAGVPIIGNVGAVSAEGDERLVAVSYQTSGKRRRLAAELLLLHEGVAPNVQLSMVAGCQHGWDELQHGWRPETDAWGSSSVATVSIAGDAGGINGARAAAHLGRIAALQIAHKLRKIDALERDRRARPERTALARQLRARRFLERLFEPTAALRIPADDVTLICRCEEVTAGELRQAVALGCAGPNQAKAFTRCGMGPCQGRMCGLTVSELIAAERGVSVAEVGCYRVRPPVKPLTVAELAGLDGLENDPGMLGGLPTKQRA